MKRTIDLDQVRVIQADNYKGNPRVYLEIADTRILYSDPYVLVRNGDGFQDNDGNLDTDSLADMFRWRLGQMLAEALLARYPELAKSWSRDTDREIDYVKPRLEEVEDT